MKRYHPANKPASTFGRAIARLSLQLQHLEQRLTTQGLGQNVRRRLKRRRRRLLAQFEQALLAREEKLQTDVEGLLSMMANAG